MYNVRVVLFGYNEYQGILILWSKEEVIFSEVIVLRFSVDFERMIKTTCTSLFFFQQMVLYM